MNELIEEAKKTLYEQIGQDKIMSLATRNGDGVANRTVNIYTYDDCFYFITEIDSNKYVQIAQNNNVALCVDAIQISGHATPMEHPHDISNTEIVKHIEEQLPHRFDRYASEADKRLVKVTPTNASYIILANGAGFVINFDKDEATSIQR